MPSTSESPSTTSLVELGRAALAAHDWSGARKAFETALDLSISIDALDGLAIAASWLHDGTTALESRERALRLYLELGDSVSAARMAIWLAMDLVEFRGEGAVAEGWLRRARSLLAGHEVSPEMAHLTGIEGHFALMLRNDTETAIARARESHRLARSLSLSDVEALSLGLEGLAMVSSGQVPAGLRMLDEAGALVISGSTADVTAAGTTFCYIVDACDRVRDYARAEQWCRHLLEFARRSNIEALLAFCRPHYAVVLMWRGAFEEAEHELNTAIEDMSRIRPPMVVEGIVRLADLRLRQGRLKDASALVRKVEHEPLAQLTRAELALLEGQPATAADLAERYLRRLPVENAVERAGGLDVMTRAQIAVGDFDKAARYLSEVEQTAAAVGTEPLKAMASAAAGSMATVKGDHELARQCFEDAVDTFSRAGAAQETARARIGLARALQDLGRRTAAIDEASKAFDALRRLGAARDADEAATLLKTLAIHSAALNDISAQKQSVLTQRETELLRLIALGKSNAEISKLTVLSVRTVERHISNIYAKIGVSGKAARASATAYAFTQGIVRLNRTTGHAP